MNLSALLSGLDTVSVLTVKSEAITVHIVFRIFGIHILVHTSAEINSIFFAPLSVFRKENWDSLDELCLQIRLVKGVLST